MSAQGTYWSLDACGWVLSPSATPDALITPWSGLDLPLPTDRPHPRDADDLLRTRSHRGVLPGQRGAAREAEEPVRGTPG